MSGLSSAPLLVAFEVAAAAGTSSFAYGEATYSYGSYNGSNFGSYNNTGTNLATFTSTPALSSFDATEPG